MIDNITNSEPQPRYINTVNGTYDNVEKRIIYGMPPVPRASMQESADTTNDAVKTSDIPANTPARVNGPSVNDGSAAPTGNGQITGLERQNGTPTSNSNEMPNHVEVSADALTDQPAGELHADYLLPEVEHLANTIAYVMDCSRD